MRSGLHGLSPYDGRYIAIGQELESWFSEAGLIRARVWMEVTYLFALSEEKIIRPFTSGEKKILNSLKDPDDTAIERIKQIEEKTNHDVQAVVNFLRENIQKTSLGDVSEFVHFGLTSEDVSNIVCRMGLKNARDSKMLTAFENLVEVLCEIAGIYKTLPMLGRTHGQPAIPTTFGKEMINFALRLHTQSRKIARFEFQGKINGAVGNFSALTYSYPHINWVSFSERFIKSLGLVPIHHTTQVNPNDDIVEYLQIIQRFNNILHGFDQDMWRYISDDQVVQKASGVGSSTMPQKINPIDFEHSEGATEVSNGLIHVLTQRLEESRLQRDLSDTPLLRFLGEIHASSLDAVIRTVRGLKSTTPNTKTMHEVLWKNWAILSEPLQLLLKHAHIQNAYDTVKEYTQGKHFDEHSWKTMVESLIAKLRITDKILLAKLRTLSPDVYIGKAQVLTETGIRDIQKKIKG